MSSSCLRLSCRYSQSPTSVPIESHLSPTSFPFMAQNTIPPHPPPTICLSMYPSINSLCAFFILLADRAIVLTHFSSHHPLWTAKFPIPCFPLYLPVFLPACLPVCLSACLSTCLSVSLPVCPSPCLVCLSICQPNVIPDRVKALTTSKSPLVYLTQLLSCCLVMFLFFVFLLFCRDEFLFFWFSLPPSRHVTYRIKVTRRLYSCLACH